MKKQCLLIALLVAIMFPSVCVRAEGIEETNDLDLWALEDIVRALEGDWAYLCLVFSGEPAGSGQER